jgi:hypothetical protein
MVISSQFEGRPHSCCVCARNSQVQSSIAKTAIDVLGWELAPVRPKRIKRWIFCKRDERRIKALKTELIRML